MKIPTSMPGETKEVILNLIDLGLRPLIVATAVGVTPQYVYIVLKKEGRTKGDGRSGNVEIRRSTLTMNQDMFAPYLERVFTDWLYAYDHLRMVNKLRHGPMAAILGMPPSKPRRGRPPDSKTAAKPISPLSVGRGASSVSGLPKPITANPYNGRSSVGVR